jgi:nucleotide-binding universal stress UspA family protein
MRTILFPTDFSDNANEALKYALAFVKDIPAKLVVLNVFGRRVERNQSFGDDG